MSCASRRQQSTTTFWLDSVSLFPSDAVGGLFRKDVVDKMKAMKPGFMRTPGGNYLEGNFPGERWNWKKTLGAAAARAGHYSCWGYWVTDGLGVYELFKLCEILDTECQMSIYTGFSMASGYVNLSHNTVFAQEAVDLSTLPTLTQPPRSTRRSARRWATPRRLA